MIFHSAPRDIFYPARRAIIYLGQETILVTASAPGQGEKPSQAKERKTEPRAPVPRLTDARVPYTSEQVPCPVPKCLVYVSVYIYGCV